MRTITNRTKTQRLNLTFLPEPDRAIKISLAIESGTHTDCTNVGLDRAV